ncbi:MAG: VOC family protein [Bryobacteraceae bacterium]
MNDLVPMLLCRDAQAAIRFYVDVLGFEVMSRMDDVGRSGFASLRRGKAQIMLASPTSVPEAPRIGGRYTQAVYYFYPADVVALREEVMAAGGAPSELAVRFYGMKEFELVDPEGHVLVFGQATDEPVTPESR